MDSGECGEAAQASGGVLEMMTEVGEHHVHRRTSRDQAQKELLFLGVFAAVWCLRADNACPPRSNATEARPPVGCSAAPQTPWRGMRSDDRRSEFAMTDASSSGLAATLIPVVVGGLIGLAGGWLGPWLLEQRKEAAEKRQRRAQKFEELVAALYEFDYWIESLRKVQAYGQDLPPEVSPLGKIEAIAAVYFPQFIDRILALDKAARDYRAWMTTAALARIADERPDPSISNRFLPALTPYVMARDALLNDLKQFAREELHLGGV